MATVSSTTPSPAPRCPPVTETAEMVSWRSSSASCGSWSLPSLRRSAGNWTVSSKGVSGRSVIGAWPYAEALEMSPIRPRVREVFSDCSEIAQLEKPVQQEHQPGFAEIAQRMGDDRGYEAVRPFAKPGVDDAERDRVELLRERFG